MAIRYSAGLLPVAALLAACGGPAEDDTAAPADQAAEDEIEVDVPATWPTPGDFAPVEEGAARNGEAASDDPTPTPTPTPTASPTT